MFTAAGGQTLGQDGDRHSRRRPSPDASGDEPLTPGQAVYREMLDAAVGAAARRRISARARRRRRRACTIVSRTRASCAHEAARRRSGDGRRRRLLADRTGDRRFAVGVVIYLLTIALAALLAAWPARGAISVVGIWAATRGRAALRTRRSRTRRDRRSGRAARDAARSPVLALLGAVARVLPLSRARHHQALAGRTIRAPARRPRYHGRRSDGRRLRRI